MEKYCTHYECQCSHAQDLVHAADSIPSRHGEFIAKAAQVFELSVRCRKLPRRGGVEAPFPEPL